MLLEGKTVVVAGIGPGLGRAIALRASEEGAAVALVSRSAPGTPDRWWARSIPWGGGRSPCRAT